MDRIDVRACVSCRGLTVGSLALLGTLAMVGGARAEDVFWSGAGLTSNWTNPNNWLLLNPPGNDGVDRVLMSGLTGRSTTTVNDSFWIHALQFQIGGFFGASWTLNQSNNSVLRIANTVRNQTGLTQDILVPLRLTGSVRCANTDDGHSTSSTMNFGAVDLNGQNLSVEAATHHGINLTGTVSGSGTVIASGPGQVVLGGSNTWSGALEIQRGTVSISGGANLGSFGNVVRFTPAGPNAHATLRRTTTGTIGSAMRFVSGEGRIETPAGVTVTLIGPLGGNNGNFGKTGAGTLVLAAAAEHYQGTTIHGGTLRLAANGTLSQNAVRIESGATLAIDASITQSIATLRGNGAIQLGAASTLRIADGDFDGTITGTNARVIKDGTGMMVLTGNNTYAGVTDITGGTLVANNSGNSTCATGTSAVNVHAGGRLAGDGRVAGTVTVASGGQIAPSNASTPNSGIGSFDIGGALNLQPGASVLIDFDNAGFDRISAVGAVHLNGELLLSGIGTSSGPVLNTNTRLIGAQAGLSGVFSSVQGVSINPQKSIAITYSTSGVFATIARPGDITLDERVNFSDLLIMAQNYGGSGVKTWSTADLTGDGAAGFDDLLLLAQNYQSPPSFQSDWAVARAMVPEPATLTLVVAASTLGLVRRQ